MVDWNSQLPVKRGKPLSEDSTAAMLPLLARLSDPFQFSKHEHMEALDPV
jgi:hypothetical protein